MIDPEFITNYNLTDRELEEYILFWVCAAGKNGRTAARCLEVFLSMITFNNMSPFEAIRSKDTYDNLTTDTMKKILSEHKTIAELMRLSGIGCYNNKSRTFIELAWSNINLKICTVDDLEKIYGIGMKTSRCFILHSRKNVRYAGLDTHILKFLKAMGYNTPKSTPTGKKYLELEAAFLNYADMVYKTPAEFDLDIWNQYSVKTLTNQK